VLLVAPEPRFLEGLAPMLGRAEFDVHAVGPSEVVLDLVSGTPFELVAAAYPLPDMPTSALLAAVRDPLSACRTAGVLLVAAPQDLHEACAFVHLGANRVVAADWSPRRLWQAFSEILDVAPRVSHRAVARLEVDMAVGAHHALGYTENLSRTGVLLRTPHQLSPGDRFSFAIELESDAPPLRGRASVVRIADPVREQVAGWGARFVELFADGRDRLGAFLANRVGAAT
jgi:DNA-binding NarL/FixJ family response regulator